MTAVEYWRRVVIGSQTSVLDVMKVIDRGALRVALVTDESSRLMGVVTDGDIRRGLLSGVNMKDPVEQVMARSPTVARSSDAEERVLALMTSKSIDHMPIVDDEGRLIGLKTLRELASREQRNNWVVLMAGGLGSRMGPLTKSCPKPMLKVGTKPILELILESFAAYGFKQFFFSVNYRKEIIQDYFKDGSAWGVDIQYLEEDDRRGTAGPLSLLPEVPQDPFFVMNGDLLTQINYKNILEFHEEHGSLATLCVRKVEQAIPYGVVHTHQHTLLSIEEKPVQEYFINAGIYLLDPKVMSYIPTNTYFDMPDLFHKVIEHGHATAAFPFLDYWMDIGRMADLKQASRDYPEVFN
ncbi:MAG: Nucleotidyl transferase [Magnetococcales bacterium]|nr:Nucleotidyl transferase [Magnetococcales bacterium]HIJ85880.1 CBS domain-containing protein [Magnetococcales bacterium]